MNNNWESKWENILKEDTEEDGESLIKIINNKIALMKAHFVDKSYEMYLANTSSEDLEPIIAMMTECYDLGDKILTYNYGEEADKLFEKYGNVDWLTNTKITSTYRKWIKLTTQAEKERNEDIKRYFTIIGNNINDWWV